MYCTIKDLVSEARSQIRETSPEALATGAGDAVVVDVREPAEFEAGHLEGAINIPRGVLEFQVEAHPALGGATDPALSVRERPLVVYCRSGARSALAAASLQRMGFNNVTSLAGGITAWAEAGLPVRTR